MVLVRRFGTRSAGGADPLICSDAAPGGGNSAHADGAALDGLGLRGGGGDMSLPESDLVSIVQSTLRFSDPGTPTRRAAQQQQLFTAGATSAPEREFPHRGDGGAGGGVTAATSPGGWAGASPSSWAGAGSGTGGAAPNSVPRDSGVAEPLQPYRGGVLPQLLHTHAAAATRLPASRSLQWPSGS
eukprot:185839-Chlamydomonas_euryale.AAC.1